MKPKTATLLSLGISAILVAAGVWILYGHGSGVWPGHHRWFMGHHGFMGGGMGIIMFIFWIFLIMAVVLLLSGLVNRRQDHKLHNFDGTNPLEILKRRYARGEIDKTEYEMLKKDLLA